MLTLGLGIMVVKYWAKFTKLNLLSPNIAGNVTQTDGNTFNFKAKLIATALSCEGVILDTSLFTEWQSLHLKFDIAMPYLQWVVNIECRLQKNIYRF